MDREIVNFDHFRSAEQKFFILFIYLFSFFFFEFPFSKRCNLLIYFKYEIMHQLEGNETFDFDFEFVNEKLYMFGIDWIAVDVFIGS